jgi:catechol 2,3-dioxygenase-like lactoylglutathione lyase family enzyme
MPTVHGVLETSLYVSDLDRSVSFYRDVLGFRLIDDAYFSGDRGAAFQVGAGPSVLLIFRSEVTRKGGVLPAHGTSGAGHAAFRVEPREIDAWREHLRRNAIPIEQEFIFGSNAPSLSFRDPDGNSLEFAVASIWSLKVG